MLNELDNYYYSKEEPLQSCFLALRQIIQSFDPTNIEELWKFGTPFFYYKGKMLCYLWSKNKGKTNYISFMRGSKIEHPALISEKRKLAKILPLCPDQDIDIALIHFLLESSIKTF